MSTSGQREAARVKRPTRRRHRLPPDPGHPNARGARRARTGVPPVIAGRHGLASVITAPTWLLAHAPPSVCERKKDIGPAGGSVVVGRPSAARAGEGETPRRAAARTKRAAWRGAQAVARYGRVAGHARQRQREARVRLQGPWPNVRYVPFANRRAAAGRKTARTRTSRWAPCSLLRWRRRRRSPWRYSRWDTRGHRIRRRARSSWGSLPGAVRMLLARRGGCIRRSTNGSSRAERGMRCRRIRRTWFGSPYRARRRRRRHRRSRRSPGKAVRRRAQCRTGGPPRQRRHRTPARRPTPGPLWLARPDASARAHDAIQESAALTPRFSSCVRNGAHQAAQRAHFGAAPRLRQQGKSATNTATLS
jgi:hypothetical protein